MRVTSRPITGWVRNLVRILPDRHLAVRTLPIPMTTGQANGRLTDINWPVAFQYDPANCIPLSVGMFEVWIPRSCNRFRSFNTCHSHDTSQRIFTLRTVRTKDINRPYTAPYTARYYSTLSRCHIGRRRRSINIFGAYSKQVVLRHQPLVREYRFGVQLSTVDCCSTLMKKQTNRC